MKLKLTEAETETETEMDTIGRQELWECSHCHLRNFAHALECEACFKQVSTNTTKTSSTILPSTDEFASFRKMWTSVMEPQFYQTYGDDGYLNIQLSSQQLINFSDISLLSRFLIYYDSCLKSKQPIASNIGGMGLSIEDFATVAIGTKTSETNTKYNENDIRFNYHAGYLMGNLLKYCDKDAKIVDDLRFNQIGCLNDQFMFQLTKAIVCRSNIIHITSLDFANNVNINDKSVQELFDAISLKLNHCLKFLCLVNTGISDETCKIIAQRFLPQFKEKVFVLLDVNLEKCDKIGRDGIVMLHQGLNKYGLNQDGKYCISIEAVRVTSKSKPNDICDKRLVVSFGNSIHKQP